MEKTADEGSIIFIKDELKCRPYVCIKVYKNNAGIPYNWLILPITSSKSVGMNNLFPIYHPKLHKESYVKLNNIQTVKWDNKYEVKRKINKQTLDDLKKNICKSLYHVERKIRRSFEKDK